VLIPNPAHLQIFSRLEELEIFDDAMREPLDNMDLNTYLPAVNWTHE